MDEKRREKLILEILKFLGKKKVYSSVKTAKKELHKQELKNKFKYQPPKKYKDYARREFLECENVEKIEYFVKDGSSNAILYLHGGAFCTRPTVFHWNFINKIYEKTGATIYMPLYPLSPKFTYKETYKSLFEFYKFLLKKHKNIFIIGDSAGATLTLGLTGLIKDKNLTSPKAIFPMSPVVDMNFDNEEAKKFEEVDPMLSNDGCKFICQKWTIGADLKNPLISPIYADFNRFPDTYLFYGTYEIFCPDLRKFVEKSKDYDFNLYSFEENKMFHTYPLFPIPKAERTQDIIAKIVNDFLDN